MGRDYATHSAYQHATAAAGEGLVAPLARDAWDGAKQPTTFVVADYGCGTGTASLAPLADAVRVAREAGAEQVACLHVDLPTNQWEELFATLAEAAESYLRLPDPPLPMAVGRSFYEPCAPRGTVHVGLSFTAVHWLREQPDVSVPEGMFPTDATGDARERLAAQAASEWRSFLSARAADLAPGGRLLVRMGGTQVAEDGRPLVAGKPLVDAMQSAALGMVEEGLLTRAAVDAYLLPIYPRTLEEVLAPLSPGGDKELETSFEVLDAHLETVPNPFFERFQSDGDAATFGRDYASWVRAFSEPSVREHLVEAGASDEQAAESALYEFYARLEVALAADPAGTAYVETPLSVALARRGAPAR
jgi:cyclopropane-fatty-acyl-phospholipid synthase